MLNVVAYQSDWTNFYFLYVRIWTSLSLPETASSFGRGLILLSLAISIYQVVTADDPWSVGERETAVTLGGIGAAAAGGALAGLARGPGAPVCVGLGAFVAGTIAAFGIQYAW